MNPFKPPTEVPQASNNFKGPQSFGVLTTNSKPATIFPGGNPPTSAQPVKGFQPPTQTQFNANIKATITPLKTFPDNKVQFGTIAQPFPNIGLPFQKPPNDQIDPQIQAYQKKLIDALDQREDREKIRREHYQGIFGQ